MRKWVFIILALLFIACRSQEAAVKMRGSADVPLPSSLKHTLSNKYPGYRVATEKDYCPQIKKELDLIAPEEKRAYGVLKADFNGDKLDDYSLIIKFKNQYSWITALNKKGAYSIREFGPPIISTTYFPKSKLEGKICDGILVIGEEIPNMEGYPRVNSHTYVGFESPAAGTQYYWKDGKWVETGYEP